MLTAAVAIQQVLMVPKPDSLDQPCWTCNTIPPYPKTPDAARQDSNQRDSCLNHSNCLIRLNSSAGLECSILATLVPFPRWYKGTQQHVKHSGLLVTNLSSLGKGNKGWILRAKPLLGDFSGVPRFSELSAVPTAMPLTGEPQSAMTPRQADFPQSQRRAVPSLEQERTFLPRSTMAVSKIPASKQRPCSDRQHGRQIDKACHFPRWTQLQAPSQCPQSATSHT